MLRFQHRPPLGHGDTVVVHHVYSAVKVLRQHGRALAASAETAGHGDMHNGVIALPEDPLPQLQNTARRGLGGGNTSACLHGLEQLPGLNVHALQVGILIDDHRHGEQEDPQLLRLPGGDAAVAVRGNRDFHSLILSNVNAIFVDNRQLVYV